MASTSTFLIIFSPWIILLCRVLSWKLSFGKLSLRIILLHILDPDHLFCYLSFWIIISKGCSIFFAHSHSKSHFASCRSEEFFFCKLLLLISFPILHMIQIGIPDFHLENCPSRSFLLQNDTPIFWLVVIMNYFYSFFAICSIRICICKLVYNTFPSPELFNFTSDPKSQVYLLAVQIL